MSYRSKRIDAAEGVVIDKARRPEKWATHAALDALALPFVALTPPRKFEVGPHSIPVYNGIRRSAWRSERSVEIALGTRALANFPPDRVLEVGNVLPMAGFRNHSIVDKYERGPGVINEDIVDFEPARRFDLAISISTLEHVGWDESPRDPSKAMSALTRIGELAERLLISIPLGYHPDFQNEFVDGPFDEVTLLVRTSRKPRWETRPLAEMNSVEYGRPYGWGNGLLVGLRGDPLGREPDSSLE